jgi:hypothetical protein
MSKIQIDLVSDASQAQKDVATLEKRVDQLAKANKDMGSKSAKAVKLVSGSMEKLEKDYKDAQKELKRLEVGSTEFEKQKKKVAELNRELKTAKGGISGVSNEGRKLTGVAGSVKGQIVGIASGFIGISAAVSAISGELEKVKRNQLAAATQTRTFEQALADIAFNVGGENLDSARTLITENAKKLGTTQEGLANLLGVAISAGADDLDEALSVVTAGLRATAGDAAKATELVQSALDIASLAGFKNFGGALGQVSQTQAVVRAVNPAEFFANVGPALATATADRANIDAISTERTLELTSVISQILKDRTGANTATAVRQFITRLDSFVPELQATLKDGSAANLAQGDIDEFRQTRGVDDRLQLFRENEALRRQFLDEQKEGIGKSAIAELIGGTERALALESKAANQITSIDKASGAFDTLTKAVDENTKVLRADRQVRGVLEQLQTQGTAGIEGAVVKAVDDLFENIDVAGIDSFESFKRGIALNKARLNGENIAESAIQLLEEEKPENALPGDRFIGNVISPQDVEAINQTQEILRGLADEIRKLRETNENGFQAAKPPAVQQVEQVNAGPIEAPVPAAGLP